MQTLEKKQGRGRPANTLGRHRRDEKKEIKLTIRLTPTARHSLQDTIACYLGENISISEMMERIARGELLLVKP